MKINFINEKQLIIQKITGLSKKDLFLNRDILSKYEKKIKKFFFRLEKGEPIEYILENAQFYGFDFFVNKKVLIPRNDTELLVEKVIQYNNFTLIDVGTGSSCIPISIIKSEKIIVKSCYALDISDEALEIAKINILKHNLENKIKLIKSNLLNYFLEAKNLKLKNTIIITANLPYIKQNDFKNMNNEVIKYEPKIALYGGKKTGFELYELLITQCIDLKTKNKITKDAILLFIEIGFDQYEISKNFINKLGLKFEYFKDTNKIERVIKINI